MADLLDEMVAKWPSAVVARTEVDKFSGGLVSSKYSANMDSSGAGIQGRVKVGKRVGYSAHELASFLRSKMRR